MQFLLITFLVLIFSGCSSSGTNRNTPSTLDEIKNWAYQLQDINVNDIARSQYDLVVIDYSSDGSDEAAFTTGEVGQMKGSGDSTKLVIAYMSIGEAEDYRYYFDADASYIERENPDWPGNYKVKYWDALWQRIIDSYLDKVISAGFDGAYLDIIDAYEYFAPGGDSGVNRESAAADMVNFVRHISEYAKAQHGDFIIIPQNGSGIINDSGMATEYFGVIDGIGAEDTFYFGDADVNNELNPQEEVLSNLEEFIENGKVVLVIDYLTDAAKIDDFYNRAIKAGFIPYATVRELNRLTLH